MFQNQRLLIVVIHFDQQNQIFALLLMVVVPDYFVRVLIVILLFCLFFFKNMTLYVLADLPVGSELCISVRSISGHYGRPERDAGGGVEVDVQVRRG